MGKWLAAGGLLLVALAVLLLYEMRGATSVDAAPPPKAAAVAAPEEVHLRNTPVPVKAPEAPALDDGKPKKIDVKSDAFFREWDDPQPKRLTKAVAACYTGGLNRVDRNAKMRLKFKVHIKDGEVWQTDVKMDESTLNNKALEQCMIQKVSEYHWHNDALPDWEQDDLLLIRPERGMRKYLPENLNYEGSGPEFPGGKAKEPVPAERPDGSPAP